jgi:hypothetical protein
LIRRDRDVVGATWGRDYGHTDVLLGRNAPEVVFPLIRDFLLEKSQVCAAAGA